MFKEFWRQAALPRIDFARGGKLTCHWPVGSSAVGCSGRADAVIEFFAAYTAEMTAILFSGPDNPENCPFRWRNWTPSNTWFLGPTLVTHPNDISWSIQPFLQGWRMWPIDRQTHRSLYSVCSNRPHLAVAAMRPNNTNRRKAHSVSNHIWMDNVALLILLKHGKRLEAFRGANWKNCAWTYKKS